MAVVIVGVPDGERVRGLGAALDAVGAPWRLVPWLTAIERPEAVHAALAPGDALRVDSPADDAATSRALERRGGAQVIDRPFGGWRPGGAWFAGLTATLRALPDGTHPADSVLCMTDKHACRLRLSAAGIPVAPGDLAPTTPAALRAWVAARRWPQVFVKARWGSAGAGVFAWRRAGVREVVRTTLRFVDGALVQGKRLHRTEDPAEIDALLAPVLADGAVVEQWIPKAGAGDRCFDLRVVVIDGVPRLRVARLSAGPITNLHLDAVRADPAALLPAATLDAVDALCADVARVFPAHRSFGVDVLVDPAHRLVICECNAWGDNVRKVTDDGLNTWEIQARALAERLPGRTTPSMMTPEAG